MSKKGVKKEYKTKKRSKKGVKREYKKSKKRVI